MGVADTDTVSCVYHYQIPDFAATPLLSEATDAFLPSLKFLTAIWIADGYVELYGKTTQFSIVKVQSLDPIRLRRLL